MSELKQGEDQVKLNSSPSFLDSLKTAVIALGSVAIIYAALGNSLTWHLIHYWGASRHLWQSIYTIMYNWTAGPHQHLLITVVVPLFVYTVVFWGFNALLLYMDFTEKPEFIRKFKIQADKNSPLDFEEFKVCARRCLFNGIIVGGLTMLVFEQLYILRGCSIEPDEIPTFQWSIVELCVFSLVEEIGFYYSHRLFHHPALYKHIHKIHHQWTAPIGITGIYCHPIEHVIANVAPALLGPLVMGSHAFTVLIWGTAALIFTSISHSGYHLPFFPSPEAHDYHHLKFNNNFGVLGILDRLHGTDALFNATKQKERHQVLFNVHNSMRELIPDDSGTCKSN